MVRALLLLLNFAPPQRTSWKHSRNFLQRRKLQESIALSVTEVVKWDKLFLGRFDFLYDTDFVMIFSGFSLKSRTSPDRPVRRNLPLSWPSAGRSTALIAWNNPSTKHCCPFPTPHTPRESPLNIKMEPLFIKSKERNR